MPKRITSIVLLFFFNFFGIAQDGMLDSEFGMDGIVISPISEDDDGNAIALQQDGKIVVPIKIMGRMVILLCLFTDTYFNK